MMGRMLRVDLRRAFGPLFWAAAALTLLVQLQGLGEYLGWLTNWIGSESALGFLHFSFNTGTFQMFMPSVAALAYSASYLRDRQSGFLRSQMVRLGNAPVYLASKVIAVYGAAFLAVSAGILAFVALLCTRMPFLPTRYPEDVASYACGELMLRGRSVSYLLCTVSFRAAAAGGWALFGLLVSTATNSLLTVFILPTLAAYALNIVMNRMGLPTLERLERGLMTTGQPLADFVRIHGPLLLFALLWAALFTWRAGRQVRA